MMKKIWMVLSIILLAFFLSGPALAATPLADHGRLSVKGTALVDSQGKTFQLKGVSTHGLSWYPEYVSKEAFQELRDKWGVNTVRLAMYTAEYHGYCVAGSQNQEILKSRIDAGVKAATDLGIYVIIDWHILSDGNPNTYKQESIAFFQEMAKKYKDNTNVLYEICNEPNGGTSWSQVKSYAQSVIEAIRNIDNQAVILVGTPTWSQDVDIAAKSPLKGYQNIMYTLHFYANTHGDAYRSKAETAIKAGLPLLVSEFGISDASGNGGVNESEGTKWITFLNEHDIGYVAWNLSNKNESCSLIKSSCNKKSGWTASDLSQSGKWLVRTYKGSLLESLNHSSSQTPNAEKPSAQKPSKSQTPAPTAQTVNGAAKSCKASVQAVNSWKNGERYFTQYKLTIKNTTEKDVHTWNVRIDFKNTIQQSSEWNGVYTYENKYLTIEPLSWNKTIPAKGCVTDIGFIISSTSKENPVTAVTLL